MLGKKLMMSANSDSYFIRKFTTCPDTYGESMPANTGIAYDKVRDLIYCAIVNYSLGPAIFTSKGRFIRHFPYEIPQGIAYDSLNDKIIVWITGGLKTYNISTDVLEYSQSIDIFGGGIAPGKLTYDNINDCLYCSYDGAPYIRVLVRSGADWVYDSDITTTGLQEGTAYDENTNTIWHNRTGGVTVNINLSGTVIKTITRPEILAISDEGLAWNPNNNHLFVSCPSYFHAYVHNGNVIGELNPAFG